MNRVILADNQAIFRAGAARVIAMEGDFQIVAQCDSEAKVLSAIDSHVGAVVVFSSSMQMNVKEIAARSHAAGGKAVVVAENGAEIARDAVQAVDGVVFRNVPGADLIECIRRVKAGRRCVQQSNVKSMLAQDSVGARVRDRLTPKEMQIVALIIRGLKNKQIAEQLNTKEQVIKNYLRSIYDKTGVSDRLELALFAIHHRVLADAAARAMDVQQAQMA